MPPPPARHLSDGVRFSIPCLAFLSLLLLFFFLALRRPSSLHEKPSSMTHTADYFPTLFLSLTSPDGGGAANDSISEHLRALTLGPHLAGTPPSSSAAAYVLRHLLNSGFRTRVREYRVLLSYPVRSSLSLVLSAGGEAHRLDLSEPSETAAPPGTGQVVPPYHAYSPSGSALAPPVYVNYGRREDYEKLAAMGVDVRGCIVLLRRGGGYRGAVVQRAAERGAAAVVIFSPGGGGGVERGTVLLGGPGDPLTPGWASVGEGERLRPDDDAVARRFPAIPSMPVPAAAAAAILRAMGGPPAPAEWCRGLAPATPLARVGGGGLDLLLNFSYEGERKMRTIRDVIGEIGGERERDRYVVLGNHRDAWTFGAVDPNSGTAALLDVARRLGVLLRRGWRPRRSILLCSWDAEEFGMIGSTEWVEENLQLLRSKAVAYLNVDCAVQGPGFFAGATPQLDSLLAAVTRKVKDPDSDDKTVYQTWAARSGQPPQVERLGRADSDFTAFLHLAGVPSLDMYFGEEYAGYHTGFDNYEWMSKHGDPLFRRHVAMAEIWGLAALHLADDPVLPFDYLAYAANLQEHASAVSSRLGDAASMGPVNASIEELAASAREAGEEAQRLRQEEGDDAAVELRRRGFNDRLMLAERAFLAEEGLGGRAWFKHLVYSPPAEGSSDGGLPPFFPGIADAAARAMAARPGEEEDGPWAPVRREVWRAARAVSRAAAALRPDLL
ncbi:peptidase M28 family protein isoform X2 [Wolffia australiana]